MPELERDGSTIISNAYELRPRQTCQLGWQVAANQVANPRK